MKVIIQTLKAPWPAGAKVGDVVAFDGESVPAWAVGKYALAPDNANANFTYEPKLIESIGPDTAVKADDPDEAAVKASIAAAEEQARQEREVAIVRQFESLQAGLDQALQERDAAKADLATALAREKELQKQLEDAQTALAAATAKPEAEKADPKAAKK